MIRRRFTCRALSFEPATKSLAVDPGKFAALPTFNDPIKPPAAGTYRILKNDASSPMVTGLDPGEYLVDSSGKVRLQDGREFSV